MDRIRYSTGLKLSGATAPILDVPRRILVAGAGTFEAVVVARAHSHAEIVAVDLSARSLSALRWRSVLAGCGLRLRTVIADLHELDASAVGSFDYIVCTGVLHHSPQPQVLLRSLTNLLSENGILRLMMYAPYSRVWIYALQDLFAARGLRAVPGIAHQCNRLMLEFPASHPLRLAFEQYSDRHTDAGTIDGFFHAYDQPIPIPTFRDLCAAESLELLGFAHDPHFDPATHPRTAALPVLNPWDQLWLLDAMGELLVNPIFWLKRTEKNGTSSTIPFSRTTPTPRFVRPHFGSHPDAITAQVRRFQKRWMQECAGALSLEQFFGDNEPLDL